MRCKQTVQTGKNLNSFGNLVKHKRIYQKGSSHFQPQSVLYLRRTQRGGSIGSALAFLARTIFPLLKSGYSALKQEALTAGSDIVKDSIEKVIKPRSREAIQNLKEKAVKKVDSLMTGSGRKRRKKGIKRKRTRKNIQNLQVARRSKTRRRRTINKKPIKSRKKSTRKKKINFKEIFG